METSFSEEAVEPRTSEQEILEAMDVKGFSQEMSALRKETIESLDVSDYHHMRKLERYGKIFTFLGYATAWIIPNPISAYLISHGMLTRWLLMHHIGHGGYDKVPGVPKRYTSKYFAQGWRRYIDWFDWIRPDAWCYEHNFLHHYHTGELTDPDLVERNFELLRQLEMPTLVKRIMFVLISISWKFTYYAPNTLNGQEYKKDGKKNEPHVNYLNLRNFYDLRYEPARKLWFTCYLPHFTFHFVLIPLAFLPLGKTAVFFVFLNRLFAEIIQNFHTFMIIVPNHTGEDLFRFESHFKNKDEFYVNQVIGSVNYHCGTEFQDFMQMWLNYQIEHHLFPDLPMTKYREIQPRVKAACKKYGIPYIQESIFIRYKKLADICAGTANMLRMDENRALVTR